MPSHTTTRVKVPSSRVAMQRHHDYFVTLARRDELRLEDEEQYELAMKREQEGLVSPIPEDQDRE